MTNDRLKLRRRLKARKPRFLREESWRYLRVKSPWRRPQGTTSRMRRRRVGWPRRASVGYKSPESLRHLHPSGLAEITVHNTNEIEGLDPSKHAVRIGRTVGERKRIGILDRARALNLRVLNPRRTRTIGTPELEQPEAPQSTEEPPSEEGGGTNREVH